MTTYEILFAAGGAVALPVFLYLALAGSPRGRFALAALTFAGFAGFTVLTVAREGALGFVPNHTSDLWGVQVWYDLVIAVALAVLFMVPRARAAGMRVPLWVLACATTGCVGVLAMAARLFWLESRNAAHAGGAPAPA